MTIGPTIAGGLKLVPEEDEDWLILLEIANDGDSDLSQRLATLMDEDSMWEDIVVPELEQEFSKQRLDVMVEVVKAKGEEAEAIHIDKESAETWYGALNQARLAIESKYTFGPRELNSPGEIEDPEARSAYFRNDFYCTIQSLLLRYVMDD
jgi:hypothetical protein|tara:strand:+ start:3079 stop:3531 length:453 start_codon:yes stop_codon:yes gene_type:complete